MSNNRLTPTSLRKAGQKIQEIMTCPHCGGSRLSIATDWQGRGAIQPLSAVTHCTCPPGPMWSRLAQSEMGREFRIVEAGRADRYDANGERIKPEDGQLVVWDSEGGYWLWIPAPVWREAVIAVEQDDPATVQPSSPGVVFPPDATSVEEGTRRALDCALLDIGRLVDGLRSMRGEAWNDREKRREQIEKTINHILSWGWQTGDANLATARYYQPKTENE